jgi:ribosomal protein S2
MQKNTEALLGASKEVGLEVNSEKTTYMLVSRKKAGQKHSMKVANRSFEGVAKFKYLGTTLTDRNCMQEEITSRLNSGNACSIQSRDFLSSACCL